MPAARVKQITLDSLVKPYDKSDRPKLSVSRRSEKALSPAVEPFVLGKEPPPFPLAVQERNAFRRTGKKTGKVTDFQWRLYDLLLTIPSGRVSTYGQLATLLSSSARAVGSALRENPFAPYVPCHRVIASTLYIGGFGGEWLPSASGGARKAAAQQPAAASVKPDGRAKDGTRTNEKLELLKREGVRFDSKGFLIDKSKIWDGKPASAE
ncbi:hypothetical protein JCM8202_004963 [Rhodotorula sphaerocarpa]